MLTPASRPIWLTMLFTVSGISELMRTVMTREAAVGSWSWPGAMLGPTSMRPSEKRRSGPALGSGGLPCERNCCLAFASEARSLWLSWWVSCRSLKKRDMSSLEPGGVVTGKPTSEVAVLADVSPDQSVGHSEGAGVYEVSSGVASWPTSGLPKA